MYIMTAFETSSGLGIFLEYLIHMSLQDWAQVIFIPTLSFVGYIAFWIAIGLAMAEQKE